MKQSSSLLFVLFVCLMIFIIACNENGQDTEADASQNSDSRTDTEKHSESNSSESDIEDESDSADVSPGESDSDTDADSDSDTDANQNDVSDSDSLSDSESHADTQETSKSDTETGAATNIDSDLDSVSDSSSDTDTVTDAVTDTLPDMESDSGTLGDPVVQTDTASNTDTTMGSDTQSHTDTGSDDPDCGENNGLCGGPCGPCSNFNFKSELFDGPSSLSVFVSAIDVDTGAVTIDGLDTASPQVPFDFDWGDGSVTSGWFQSDHTYLDTSKNYVVTVTAHYSDNTQDTAKTLARFGAPSIDPQSLPVGISVTIPDTNMPLDTRLYNTPTGLSYFDDTFFPLVTRDAAEYVLSVAATLQYDFVNEDVFLVDAGFNQVVLRDSSANGMYSLWYTSPVAFGCADCGFSGTLEYSSFFHEMGHNISLNTPSEYYFGGRIDGNANTIYSETMAQIFQHATTYTLLNGDNYGLSEDLLFEIEQNALASMQHVRLAYEEYVNNGSPFVSWNDPSTTQDDTVPTFMTIAYKFFEQAENLETGYRVPLKRMMAFLQKFDSNWEAQYDRNNNTAAAETFRATLMVAAVSYAFDADLRADFRTLNFPVDDQIFTRLLSQP